MKIDDENAIPLGGKARRRVDPDVGQGKTLHTTPHVASFQKLKLLAFVSEHSQTDGDPHARCEC